MNALEERNIQCPYCWETISVLVDCSEEEQHYVEDCQVCCRPIEFDVSIDTDGDVALSVYREDD
jgi:hypothetical protein